MGPTGAPWFIEFFANQIGCLAITINTHEFNSNSKSNFLWRERLAVAHGRGLRGGNFMEKRTGPAADQFSGAAICDPRTVAGDGLSGGQHMQNRCQRVPLAVIVLLGATVGGAT